MLEFRCHQQIHVKRKSISVFENLTRTFLKVEMTHSSAVSDVSNELNILFIFSISLAERIQPSEGFSMGFNIFILLVASVFVISRQEMSELLQYSTETTLCIHFEIHKLSSF